MIAEKAKVENLGECKKCGEEKDLTRKSSSNGGKICEDCFLKLSQIPLGLDEYDLRPDELTKEQFAEKASVTLRTVEGWKKDGKIAAEKLRRRVNGVVRKQLIFKVADVNKFLNKENEAVKLPTVETEKTKNELQTTSQAFGNDNLLNLFGAMFEQINSKLDTQPKISRLTQISGKMFLDLDEAARFSGIGKTKLETAIHAAEREKLLERFSGERGKSVWRTEDLEKIIESIPSTPIVKRLPPKKNKE